MDILTIAIVFVISCVVFCIWYFINSSPDEDMGDNDDPYHSKFK